MLTKLHAAAGILGLMIIAGFWSATALSELIGTPAQITTVKTAILYGMVLLVPALATAGIIGARLGRGMKLPQVTAKTSRTRIIAANGLLVLLPSAAFLALRAQAALFDTAFYAVQGLELLAGAANITLLSLNLRDGLRIRARMRAARR
ncbi:hypothetical protein [Antarcticimicrobium luteum]|uniref:Uncharacterized protein n=1 Tax=Antarcticimicrobium luteum TaxID=2547397 RepID=A0A4V3AQK6_9RHOB|nr:hypothetical protein [Antarcticimicrobium luteum]TDK43117.1 hypothetical protein E1832_17835 [Antarcticimicrobium luteum]